ncbi:MAG TPA: PH domain-containing protein [Acidimicrobiales bacterium]|nr:PH domain-containing protein [Acidimicrobiales bacterium]
MEPQLEMTNRAGSTDRPTTGDRTVWRRQEYQFGRPLVVIFGVVAVVGNLWVAYDAGSTPAMGRVADALAITVAALGVALYCYLVLVRPSLVADSEGLTVRNARMQHGIPWSSVMGFWVTSRELFILRYDHGPVRVEAASVPGSYASQWPTRVAQALEARRLQHQAQEELRLRAA